MNDKLIDPDDELRFTGIDQHFIPQEVIQIDPDKRYVAIISSNNMAALHEGAKGLEKLLKDWWESGEKFLVLAHSESYEVRIERLDSKGE